MLLPKVGGKKRGIARFSRPAPYPSVDAIIENRGKVLLIKRGIEPFKGKFSLPGGFVEWGESVESCALRETREETGIRIKLLGIVGVYSKMGRDPRGSTISTVFAAKPVGGRLKGGTDAREPQWIDVSKAKSMLRAFDHAKIFSDYMRWRRKKGTYWSNR